MAKNKRERETREDVTPSNAKTLQKPKHMDEFFSRMGEITFGPGFKTKDRLRILLRRRYFLFTVERFSAILGIACLTISPIVFEFWGYLVYIPITIGLVLLVNALLINKREYDFEIHDLRSELDLEDIKEDPKVRRAEKLFKRHQFEVRKYYDLTLRHSGWIFGAGLVCILLGFVIIGGAIYFVTGGNLVGGTEGRQRASETLEAVGLLKEGGAKIVEELEKVTTLGEVPDIAGKADITEKVVVGILGAVGGILANFVSVIYLRMFSKTMESLTDFHNKLVGTHRLHFANFLVAKIGTKGLREETLAEVALGLCKGREDKKPDAKGLCGEQPEGTSVGA